MSTANPNTEKIVVISGDMILARVGYTVVKIENDEDEMESSDKNETGQEGC